MTCHKKHKSAPLTTGTAEWKKGESGKIKLKRKESGWRKSEKCPKKKKLKKAESEGGELGACAVAASGPYWNEAVSSGGGWGAEKLRGERAAHRALQISLEKVRTGKKKLCNGSPQTGGSLSCLLRGFSPLSGASGLFEELPKFATMYSCRRMLCICVSMGGGSCTLAVHGYLSRHICARVLAVPASLSLSPRTFWCDTNYNT